ncbi:hypothetical protein LSH36_35g08008 [Paralvinella palmiformis]|uniref:SAM domain-containing protein n=1 Tax=Paralvinella palmiformis TaxID=53620 RepID=A0AAD9NEA3_9ANNE|nr:hypothetical protein LSH36_35g08008 [Paralvinella palmiformis]
MEDQMYWLKGIIKVPRIIVVNDYNAYFTIPVNCSQPIKALKDGVKVGSQTTIKKFVEQNSHKTFMFVSDKKQYVYSGASSGEMTKLGTLTIVDRYDERYLMGHALYSGRLYHETTVIPAYMPITLVIAATMATGDHKQFHKMMLDIYNFTNSIPKEVSFPMYIKNYEEIMMFDQKPIKGDYDTLSPIKCVTFNKDVATERHIYTPLDAKLTNTHPPVLPPKSDMTMKLDDQKFKSDRSRVPTPPIDFPLEGDGETTGRLTNISQMARTGYHVVHVEPLDVLSELLTVFKTGVIPNTSSVKMVDFTNDGVKRSDGKHISATTTATSAVPVPICRQSLPVAPLHPDVTHHADIRKFSNVYATPQSPPPNRLESMATSKGNSSDVTKSLPSIQLQDELTNKLTSKKNQGTLIELPVSTSRRKSEINAFEDIPKDISNLDSQAIGQCLALLHLSSHRRRFEEDQVDGCLLLELDADLLQTDFGFSKFEALKLMKFAHGWRPTHAAVSSRNESSL